jgi:low temperature requirement protein LtrA
MIQRIQTIYLALAALSCISLFGLPFATTNEMVAASSLFADGRYTIADNFGLIFLFVGAGLLAIGSIFLYSNRALQNNLTRVAAVATIIGLVLGILLFLRDGVTKTTAEPNDGLGIFMPILTIVFLFLALRSIKNDDKLVRSADRLRG